MDNSTGNSSFAPESPDLTNYYQDLPEPVPQHQSYRGSISHSLPWTPGGTLGLDTNQAYIQNLNSSHGFPQLQSPNSTMPPKTRGKRVMYDEDDYAPETPIEPTNDYLDLQPQGNGTTTADTSVNMGITVKTKFPVARIKRIMQADDDVGKVAQVTPVAVSKALELFMISLVTKAAAEARVRNQKRVSAAHLKQAITKDKQFDFLEEIVSKVADAPAAADKMDEDESGEPKKRKSATKRKKKEDKKPIESYPRWFVDLRQFEEKKISERPKSIVEPKHTEEPTIEQPKKRKSGGGTENNEDNESREPKKRKNLLPQWLPDRTYDEGDSAGL